MNKIKNHLWIALVSLTVLSCGKEEEIPFQFTLASKQSVIIPAKTQTCREEAIAAVNSYSIADKYFSLYLPGFEWTGNTNAKVTLIAIKLTVNSPFITGGKATCLIAGQDLEYLYFDPGTIGSDNPRRWEPYNIGTGRGTSYWTEAPQSYYSCPIRCGGIKTKENVNFVAFVNIEVIAVSRLRNDDGTYDETPYRVTTSATVRNLF